MSDWVFLKLSQAYDVVWPNPVYSFNPAAACFYLLMRRCNNNICRLSNGGVGASPGGLQGANPDDIVEDVPTFDELFETWAIITIMDHLIPTPRVVGASPGVIDMGQCDGGGLGVISGILLYNIDAY